MLPGMGMTTCVSIAADVASQIQDGRLRYVSTVGEAKYRCAASWSVDGVAKDASASGSSFMVITFQQPRRPVR